MQPRILPLSEDAISQIHSSKQITSLSGVVLALVTNALDANATKVDVSVSFVRGSCTVEDNGCGIPSAEFAEHGGLGKMHHTSKATTEHALHGNAGTYIASLGALSLISITSQHAEENLSANLTMYQGRVIARQYPSSPSNELIAFGTHGTRIAVDDLFGNMPVRVKQRSLNSAQGVGVDEKSWLELKCDIAALLLAWKSPCSVKLRDRESQSRNVTLSGSHSTVSSALTERNINTLHGKALRYDLRDAFPVLFQAGLAPLDSRPNWIPVSASTSKISCRGLICLDPSPMRLCQFISIGIHPCSSTSGHNTLFEAINKLFSNSSFGTVDTDLQSKSDTSAGDVQRQIRTSKSVDRWPMYVLQVSLKDHRDKLARGPSDHQLEYIVEVLEAVTHQWLSAHHFRPRQKRTRKPGADHNPTSTHFERSGIDSDLALKRQRTASTMVDNEQVGKATHPQQKQAATLDHLSRIKGGKRNVMMSRASSSESIRSSAAPTGDPFVVPALEPGSLSALYRSTKPHRNASLKGRSDDTPVPTQGGSSDDYGSIDDADLLKTAISADVTAQDNLHDGKRAVESEMLSRNDVVEWKNSITKETYMINSRTGIIQPTEDRSGTGIHVAGASERKKPATTSMAMTAAGRPLTINGRASSANAMTCQPTVPTFLQDWDNPVFARQAEQSIPIASFLGPGLETSDLTRKCCSNNDASLYFAASGNGTESKLSKADLQNAKVISQVDAKFILCSMPGIDSNSQTLVLVDQHAASERVILESLLSDLYAPIDASSTSARLRTNTGCSSTVATILLETPLVFELLANESDLLRTQAPLFAQYGILYDLHATTQSRTHHTLSARALPPGISERCKLFPKLLIDLLRSEIWSRVESGKPMLADLNASHGNTSWLRRLGTCPKVLLEMLNSRACRSAVMFNDLLSVPECADLVGKLGKCAFPFMCAHGRVSMVPVGVVGGDSGSSFKGEWEGDGAGEGAARAGFVDAWRRCKGNDIAH
jgi:DNA mismatch repair protein MLH3